MSCKSVVYTQCIPPHGASWHWHVQEQQQQHIAGRACMWSMHACMHALGLHSCDESVRNPSLPVIFLVKCNTFILPCAGMKLLFFAVHDQSVLPSVVSETHRRSGTQEVAVSLIVAKRKWLLLRRLALMLHKRQAKQKWLSWQWKQFDGLAALNQVNSFQV